MSIKKLQKFYDNSDKYILKTTSLKNLVENKDTIIFVTIKAQYNDITVKKKNVYNMNTKYQVSLKKFLLLSSTRA